MNCQAAAGLMFLAWAAIVTFGCKTSMVRDDVGNQSSVKVVGGEQAEMGQFPSALFIPGCSATKISPSKILTAAHCVVGKDGKVLHRYQKGQRFEVYHGVKLVDARRFVVEVDSTQVNPQYLQKLTLEENDLEKFADVAVIHTKDSLPDDIPSAELYFEALNRTEEIIFTGYGCEDLPPQLDVLNDDFGSIVTSSDDTLKQHRLKFKAVEVAYHDHAMIIVRNRIVNSVLDENADEKKFSGCMGDSGSAAYFRHGETLKVVGVNSFVNPLESAITRIDKEAPNEVAAWLCGACQLEGK